MEVIIGEKLREYSEEGFLPIFIPRYFIELLANLKGELWSQCLSEVVGKWNILLLL